MLFGVYVGIATRNVSTRFNESKNAALAIYNVLITGGVMIGAIFLLGAKGDMYIVLLLILLFCVPTVSFSFTCLSRFLSCFAELALKQSQMSKSNTAGSKGTGTTGGTTGGSNEIVVRSTEFEFPSVGEMNTLRQIDRYISLIERQIRAARKRLLAEGGHLLADKDKSNAVGLTQLSQQPSNLRAGDSSINNINKSVRQLSTKHVETGNLNSINNYPSPMSKDFNKLQINTNSNLSRNPNDAPQHDNNPQGRMHALEDYDANHYTVHHEIDSPSVTERGLAIVMMACPSIRRLRA